MERVEFRADNKNKRSIAMKSIGCKEEGVLRNHMPTSKKICDVTPLF
jgi:RimJ/RimL family protein N-acetyltransferase